jgi:hypothetical protein
VSKSNSRRGRPKSICSRSHLVEISDGALKFTHIQRDPDFEILYAASDRLTFTAPSSLDTVLKVEAKEKKEVLKLATEGQLSVWQVLLQAPSSVPCRSRSLTRPI